MGQVMGPCNFRDNLSSVGWDLLWSTCTQNLKSLCLPTAKIWKAMQNVKIGSGLGVIGHLQLPAMSPFDTAHMTSYLTLIETMQLYTHIHFMAIWTFCGITRMSWYQKGKTSLDFTEARDSEWQWHQLGHIQICTLSQTDNHTSIPHSVFTGQMPFLPPNQQRQSTEGNKHWRQQHWRQLRIYLVLFSSYSELIVKNCLL